MSRQKTRWCADYSDFKKISYYKWHSLLLIVIYDRLMMDQSLSSSTTIWLAGSDYNSHGKKTFFFFSIVRPLPVFQKPQKNEIFLVFQKSNNYIINWNNNKNSNEGRIEWTRWKWRPVGYFIINMLALVLHNVGAIFLLYYVLSTYTHHFLTSPTNQHINIIYHGAATS